MASFWRDIGSALGVCLPSDEEMGFGPVDKNHTLCANCGNHTRTKSGYCETCNSRKSDRN